MKDFSIEIVQGLKDVQLDIALEIDRICRENKLRYFLAYGTLLGAIRHDGFIPWDDDIDIMMPYDDLVKFGKIFNNVANTEQYFYQSAQTDPEYGLVISRVCRNDSIILDSVFGKRNINHGIFVDIYPLFGVSEGKLKRKIQLFRAMRRALYTYNEPPKHKGKIITMGSKILLGVKSNTMKKNAAMKLTEKLALTSFDNSDCVCDLSSKTETMRRIFKKEWFGEKGIEHKFEQYSLMVPIDYDSVLKTVYGDYMTLPPKEAQKFHHDYKYIKLPDGKAESL